MVNSVTIIMVLARHFSASLRHCSDNNDFDLVLEDCKCFVKNILYLKKTFTEEVILLCIFEDICKCVINRVFKLSGPGPPAPIKF